MADTVNTLACRYRWGLSATPEREDGLHFVLEWVLGPVLHRIEQAGLLEAGHLVPADVVQVHTGWFKDFDWTNCYVQAVDELLQDPERNQLIARFAADELVAGGAVLVLSQRKAHCEELARLIRERHHQVEVLDSDRPKKARVSALCRLRSGELRCVVATQLADEGLDVPCLTAVLLTAPSAAEGRTVQRLGRVMRPYPGKGRPKLIDFVDERAGVLIGQARKRMRAYRKVLGEVRPRVVDPKQRELAC